MGDTMILNSLVAVALSLSQDALDSVGQDQSVDGMTIRGTVVLVGATGKRRFPTEGWFELWFQTPYSPHNPSRVEIHDGRWSASIHHSNENYRFAEVGQLHLEGRAAHSDSYFRRPRSDDPIEVICHWAPTTRLRVIGKDSGEERSGVELARSDRSFYPGKRPTRIAHEASPAEETSARARRR